MPRAPKKCGRADCETRVTGRNYCEPHTPMNWAGAARTGTSGGKAWRTAVLSRDRGVCQIRDPHCMVRATEADHITPVAFGGAEYDTANGQAACTRCHKTKTQREAVEGRRRASA